MVKNESASYAIIDGTTISDLELLRYEVSRARAASALLLEKLGPEGMADLFRDELAAMHDLKNDWLRDSAGSWTGSITGLHVTGGSASGFLHWFQGRVGADDSAMLNDAHPEHFAVVREPDGRVSILETTGGWKAPSLFYARFTQKESEAAESSDPALPIRLIGLLESRGGAVEAKVLHQFGDTPEGFRARLGIYWPAKADLAMVKGHQWHLACEFVNWSNMYLQSLT